MRTLAIVAVLMLGITACNRPNEESRQEKEQTSDERMRQAGRTAYDAAQKAEEAAKELSREVDRAGKQVREGWDQAKREHESKKQ